MRHAWIIASIHIEYFDAMAFSRPCVSIYAYTYCDLFNLFRKSSSFFPKNSQQNVMKSVCFSDSRNSDVAFVKKPS